MEGKTAVVLGATGLTGAQVVEYLLADDYFSAVRILVRRPVNWKHEKLNIQVVDFNDPHDLDDKLGKGDIVFCCIGTTTKKVRGDKTAYRKVDYDIPINTARRALQKGFDQFLLMSAVGANTASANFYLQLKGSVEEDLAAIPFNGIHIFRPSILMGKRKERRFGESAGKLLMPVFSFILRNGLRKYKPIHSSDVAKAMVAASKLNRSGVHTYQYDEMKQLQTI